LPIILLGPFAGTAVDRYSRRKILIFSDLLNALVVTVFALYLFKIAAATHLVIIGLFAVAVFFGITVALLLLAGFLSGLGAFYYVSLAISSIIFARQIAHTRSGMDRERAFADFKSNVTAGFIILCGIILNYAL